VPLLSLAYREASVRKADKTTITKKAFVEKLGMRTGYDPKVVNQIFLETLDLIVDELKDGNKLEFRGAFILGTKIQESRMAQNPKTLEKVEIPERRVVYFKKGDRLKHLDD
jgi:integration host factor subunit beta